MKLASFMQYKSQLMWQKGYAIKAKNDVSCQYVYSGPSISETPCILEGTW